MNDNKINDLLFHPRHPPFSLSSGIYVVSVEKQIKTSNSHTCSLQVELAAVQNCGFQQCSIMLVFYRNASDSALTAVWVHLIVVSFGKPE